MDLTITIPESAAVTAERFLSDAARGWGWHPDQGITAEEFVMDRVEEDLWRRFSAHRKQAIEEQIQADLPRPESRGARVAREREAAREAAEKA